MWKEELQNKFKTYGQWPSARFIYLSLLTLTPTHHLEVNSPTSNTCALSVLL